MWSRRRLSPGMCLLLLLLILSGVASGQTMVAVRQDGAGGAYESITEAIASIPAVLPSAYIVEIQDGGTYRETVQIVKTTSATSTLTIRAQAGQTPKVVAQERDYGAINILSHYVTLEGLILKGSSRKSGVLISWMNNNTVRNCTVFGGKDRDTPGVNIQGGQYNEIVGNTIRNNEVGVLIYGSSGDHNTVRNNVIRNNQERGVWIYHEAHTNLVINNTLYRNNLEVHLGEGGSGEDPGEDNVFRNNAMLAKKNGICFAVDQYGDPGTMPSGTISDYNALYAGTSGSKVGRMDGTELSDHQNWQAVSGVDGHSLETDPLLLDATSDMHLQSTVGSYHDGAWTADANHSPCIDAGDPSDQYADEQAPNGGRINIGAYGNTLEASRSETPEPQGEFNEVAQTQDGSGLTDASIEVAHAAGGDTRARIEWSDAEAGTYAAATLSGPATADHEDSGGPPDVSNANQYQLGSGGGARIVTSEGSNTVTFDWQSATDLPAGDGTYWLRLTVNDEAMDQTTPDRIAVTLDHVAPAGLESLAGTGATVSTITWAWTAVSTESHFDHYEIWYGTNSEHVQGRTGSAIEWDTDDYTALGTMATNTTTIPGLEFETTYFARIWATDQYGNEATVSVAQYVTAGMVTSTHYVAKTGSDPGVPDDPSHPWLTIQGAIDDMPDDLVAAYANYSVEVQDSGDYDEQVAINNTTNEDYSIVLRSAEGQMPTVVAPRNKDGILIESSYVTVQGLAVDASNRYGVSVSEADYVVIRNCEMYGGSNDGGVELYRADYCRLEGNRIHGNRYGVYLSRDADYNSVRNNLILHDGSGDCGVYVGRDADGDTLINNVIVGQATGLQIKGGSSPAGDHHVVRNTIFHAVGRCLNVAKPLGDTFDECNYNDLHPDDGGQVGRISRTSYETLAEWRAASGVDANSISQDPLFADVAVDPGDMDVHLMSAGGRWDGSGWVTDAAASPCIDVGNPYDDYASETDPHGNRINMGAYGNTEEASKSGPITVYLGDIPWGTYVFGGVPLIPVDPSPDAVLGDDFPGEGEDPWGYWWSVVRWNVSAADYAYYREEASPAGNPPDFHPGRGYWLIQWWSLEYHDGSTAGDTISVTGTQVPLDTDFTISLEFPEEGRGVNQLANPFLFPIDWATARIRDNDSGQERSMAEAADDGWVDGYAYLWNWEEEYYEPISSQDGGNIEPWLGFWVEQLQSGLDLSLVLPPVVAAAGKPLAAGRPSGTDWYMQFSVSVASDSAEYRDDFNRIGVKPDASRRYDSHDAVDLPGFGEHYVYAYFPHDDPGKPQAYWPERPNRYTYDMRDPEWVDQVWTFVVETDLTDAEMTWTWTNVGGLPRGCQVALEDADADSVIIEDIRMTPTQRFASGPTGVRRFRLRAAFEDIPGDVTGDRSVRTDDAAQVLQYAVGLDSLPDFALELANVSGSAKGIVPEAVTPFDAALILRYAAGITDAFPVDGEPAPEAPATERVTYLSYPQARGDGSYAVPLVIDEMDGVLSGLVRISFEGTEVEDVVAGDPGVALVAFAARDGDLIAAFAGSRSREGRGTLVEVRVRPTGAENEILRHLRLDAIQLNEGLVRAGVSPTSIAQGSARPEAYCLYPSFPNPFNPTTSLRYDLPEAGAVELSIYNAAGQRVRTLVRQDQRAGVHTVSWDGRDVEGRELASGVYLCRMVAGGYKMVRKLALIR
jgi:parallel beta-helix repeat protein